MADKIKLLLAALIVAGGVAAFYVLGDQALFVRVLALLALLGVGVAVAARTEVGAASIGFIRGAITEAKKVVWPSRKETTQTTLVVLAMVVAVGIILWVFDMFLAWAVQLLTGQGS